MFFRGVLFPISSHPRPIQSLQLSSASFRSRRGAEKQGTEQEKTFVLATDLDLFLTLPQIRCETLIYLFNLFNAVERECLHLRNGKMI